MPERQGSFNVFGAPTLRDVKVGYISTETGYVSGIGLWDANVYAKKNPGTTFIFNTRDRTEYLNINEVNKLTVDDLPRGKDGCGGAEIFKKDSEDKDPKIIFSGGGGVGAQANPIIGQDGSLLGVHLISGGFGYKYPPQVSIEDPTGYAAGAVIRCGIGSTVTTYETYEEEEDFEEYFPPHIMALAPPNVGFGDQFINGKNIGAWNPYKYVDPQQTPFEQTVKNYMKELRDVQNPWWTTHEAPSKVTGDNRSTKTFYKVKHGVWGEFLNSYAISPVPMSRSKGSDFPGRWYTFEWEDVEFPYDGEYNFRAQCDNDARFFLDNEAVSEFKIGEGGAAGSVLSNPLHFKETITKGKHNLKLELYNHPILEDVTVQGDEISTRQEIQVAGGDFILKSNGYHLAVGGNEETELVLTLEYNDNPRTAGTAVTKITIPNPNGPDLVLEREKDSNGNFKTKGSVSAKGVFKRSEFGYGPFIVEGNSGSTKLVRQNLTYGVNSVKYGQIDFLDSHGSDTNGSLKLVSAKNLQKSRTVIEAPISSESTKLKTVFNTVDYINKANRKLWRINAGSGQGFINDYGICPFDTTVVLPDNPYAGTHDIKWNNVNFPVSGNYIIEIAVDDNVTFRIGDEIEIRKEGFTKVNGRTRGTGKLREVRYIKEGTYNLNAALEQIVGGKFGFGKGLNPMALAINITTAFTKEERVKQVDWHYNPMGVAMIIEAPAPPIPQQPKPVQEGRCPANPFWTTRFAGGTTQWHPVYVEGWGKFLNKYAMSPVPPYDADSTSGGGIPFENEWTVDIPYDGFYKLKGSADDNSQFYIDGKLELETKRSGKVKDEAMVFLNEGTSKIRVVVENYLFEEKQLIDQKIFKTADWVNAGGETGSKTQTVDFKVTTNSAFINSIDIKGLFYEQGPKLIAGEDIITPPPQVKPAVDAGVEFIKRGSSYFMAVTGNDLVEVGFDFRYVAPPSPPDPVPVAATMKFVKKSDKYFLQVTGNYLVDVALEFRYYIAPPPTPAPPPTDATMKFVKSDGKYFLLVTGNDLVDVQLEFRYAEDDPNLGGGDSVTSISIDTEESTPLTFTKSDGPHVLLDGWPFRGGRVRQNATFKNGKQYEVTFNKLSGTSDPIIGPAGSLDNTSTADPDQRINFFDRDTSGGATPDPDIFGDVRAYFTATTITQLSPAPTTTTTPVSPIAVTSVTIQTENDPITYERSDGPRTLDGWPGNGGVVTQNGTFLNGREYEVTFDTLAGVDDPIIGPAGSLDNTSAADPDQRINFFDTDTSGGATSGADIFGDVRAYFTATSITQLSNPPVPASTASPVAVQGITIQTNDSPLTFRRTDGPRDLSGWPFRGGSVVKKAIFKNGVEYPISFKKLTGADDPIIDAAGSLDNVSREIPGRRINFFDLDTSGGATSGPDSFGDTRAHFTATTVKQLSTPEVETFESFSVAKTQLRQLDGKPNITKEVEIGREYIVEIKNAGQGLMGNFPAPLAALKTDGGVLMAEDIPGFDEGAKGGITHDDLVCTASHGRFYDINKNMCKYKVERKSPIASGTVTGGTVKDGVTYEGPRLATYAKSSELGSFLSPYHTTPEEIQGKTWIMKWNDVNFPETGQYNLKMQADDELKMRIDGKEVAIVKVREGLRNFNFNIATKGPKTLELELMNISIPNTTFKQNPTVAAALITKKMSVSVKVDGKIKTKSWKENPVGVSGILIPPPCPNVVGGTGVVDDVRPIVPGNGFTPPTGPGYPVGLKLKRIDIDTPGINYNIDDPVEIDGPGKAHICEMDSYGRIKKICLGDKGDDTSKPPVTPTTSTTPVGITDYPRISINSPTGSGFRGTPIVEVVPDPVDPGIDRDKLLQVTDLVGIKQTGYYDGRAYYGAIFYKDGIKYAGYYETAGQLVQIYDTLQESIDAQVTTPASAILRQGTDISSDNPRLDIPGTPDNLT